MLVMSKRNKNLLQIRNWATKVVKKYIDWETRKAYQKNTEIENSLPLHLMEKKLIKRFFLFFKKLSFFLNLSLR